MFKLILFSYPLNSFPLQYHTSPKLVKWSAWGANLHPGLTVKWTRLNNSIISQLKWPFFNNWLQCLSLANRYKKKKIQYAGSWQYRTTLDLSFSENTQINTHPHTWKATSFRLTEDEMKYQLQFYLALLVFSSRQIIIFNVGTC